VPEDEWDPLSAEDVAGLGKPFVAAGGFLRLNKLALAHLIEVLGQRPATGFRDLTVLLALLTLAGFRGPAYMSGAEGAVPGTDTELAREIGVEPKTFTRAVDELVYRQYLERLGPTRPAGYRVTRVVWEWLQAEEMPGPPDSLDVPDPFASTRPRRSSPRR